MYIVDMKDLLSQCLHKDLNKKVGIYLIQCNERKYVGSSINIYYRLKRHASDLLRNKHQNPYMQNIFNKYKTDFRFEVIEECSKDVLKLREKYYIDQINPCINLERNPVTREFSKESIDQIRKTLKEGYATGRIKSLSEKQVYRYNSAGKYIDSYESCVKAAKALGLSAKKICAAAAGSNKSSGGFIWSYINLESNCKSFNGNKPVGEFDTNDLMIRSWNSLNEASAAIGKAANTLSTRITRKTLVGGLKYQFIPVPDVKINPVNCWKSLERVNQQPSVIGIS